mmetsp:Transcript_53727/g.105070  ORF Transcript_53727/g.105070 Transcript_53727/m.105070 type:complete len:82 (+) Transcript_53727:211-456(+)
MTCLSFLFLSSSLDKEIDWFRSGGSFSYKSSLSVQADIHVQSGGSALKRNRSPCVKRLSRKVLGPIRCGRPLILSDRLTDF